MSISQGSLTARVVTESLFGTTEEERDAARRRVAEFAQRQDDPAGDLRELLDMIGLLDDVQADAPTGCRVCGGELKPWTLGPKSGMKGCCSRPCRKKFLEGQPAAPKPARSPENTGRCGKCGVPTYLAQTEDPIPGGKRYGARGLCGTCYSVVRRAEKKAEKKAAAQ